MANATTHTHVLYDIRGLTHTEFGVILDALSTVRPQMIKQGNVNTELSIQDIEIILNRLYEDLQ